ncbi:MAG: signal peptidase I, partial [Thermoguttaceae bacterium]
HYRYQVSASDNQKNDVASTVYHGTCPMCRFTDRDLEYLPSYDGDRILVAKFPYEFADPKRWDVIVFKYPGNATLNYIKRLVGKPGETIQIRAGDLWIRSPNGDFEIARKPPEKLLAMLQLVYDNDLAPTISGDLHWPARWTPESDKTWTSKDLSSFEIDEGSAQDITWIRYRHRVPTPDEWQRRLIANQLPQDNVEPQLISDFTAYNTSFNDQSDRNVESLIERGYGLHWVGDLAVQFELESKNSPSESGIVVTELIKGGCQFQCILDLAAGTAKLAIRRNGQGADPEADAEADRFHPAATTPGLGRGRHAVIFSNVDDELRLWIDGSVVAFDGPTTYHSEQLHNRSPTKKDLAPIGIAAQKTSVKVSHIKALRDVYYIAVFDHGKARQPPGPLKDFKESDSDLKNFREEELLLDQKNHPRWEKYVPDLKRPETWHEYFQPSNMETCTITLDPPDPAHPEKDQFFVLGDNSAQSADGRLWVGQWWVERELLIGKALFIYWPHGWKIPYVPLPVNMVPYFQRMHLVR